MTNLPTIKAISNCCISCNIIHNVDLNNTDIFTIRADYKDQSKIIAIQLPITKEDFAQALIELGNSFK